MQKIILTIMIIFSIMIYPFQVLADIAEGDMIITLGENLSEEQKNLLIAEMNAPKDVTTITVSNQEEHQYLGNYVPKSLIGTRAISSSAITIGPKDSGLSVETKNITWVSDEMYINALITAGVKDAKIYITAPIPVSGTAALTGIIKAYEVSASQTIPEEIKQVANEEMVATAKLGDSIGTEKAAALITKVKTEMVENTPQNEDEIRVLIEQAAKELGILLSEQEIKSLIELFNRLQDLNIDWNLVGEQLNQAKDSISTYLSSEEGQNFLEKLKAFFTSLFDTISSFFSEKNEAA